MSGASTIEWTDATWNPVRGCTRVSEGCRNCYAETVAARFSGPGLPYEGLATRDGGKARWTGKLSFGHDREAPLRWRRPRRIFVNSMSDLFHEAVLDEWIDQVFAIMALCPQHTFQVLTKRPERMRAYLGEHGVESRVGRAVMDIAPVGRDIRSATLSWTPRCAGQSSYHDFNGRWPLPNVWLGTSCEDQATADTRVPELLATPAAVRFVSAEPLLGPIDFEEIILRRDGEFPTPLSLQLGDYVRPLTGCFTKSPCLHWIIGGGESGPRARPMHPAWARSIRDQCTAAGVPFFFKQWGEWLDELEATARHLAPGPEMFDRFGSPKGPKWHFYEASDRNGGTMIRVGKKAAGRLLDGVEHNGMPQVAA